MLSCFGWGILEQSGVLQDLLLCCAAAPDGGVGPAQVLEAGLALRVALQQAHGALEGPHFLGAGGGGGELLDCDPCGYGKTMLTLRGV